jgi:hypothetical protein
LKLFFIFYFEKKSFVTIQGTGAALFFRVAAAISVSVQHMLCWMGRHTNDIKDPYMRTQWKHCKQNLTKEFHIVRLFDAERQVFRDVPSNPKYINNNNNSTAISPLCTRPPFINIVNGDKGQYNNPGSLPFSRPIVIFSRIAIQCGSICVM